MKSAIRAPRPPRRWISASPKARGELAEARFLAKALDLGFVVSKPFGDNARYDFVVESAGRLSRVQVKSAWTRRSSGYDFLAAPSLRKKGRRRPYRAREIDFLVAYVAPEEAWFIIPHQAIASQTQLYLSMGPSNAFVRYREAWELLRFTPVKSSRGAAQCDSPGRKPGVDVG